MVGGILSWNRLNVYPTVSWIKPKYDFIYNFPIESEPNGMMISSNDMMTMYIVITRVNFCSQFQIGFDILKVFQKQNWGALENFVLEKKMVTEK